MVIIDNLLLYGQGNMCTSKEEQVNLMDECISKGWEGN